MISRRVLFFIFLGVVVIGLIVGVWFIVSRRESSEKRTQQTEQGIYTYKDIQFTEPHGWSKSFPFKTTLPDGKIIGPDDVMFSNGERVISVSSGGNLDSVLDDAKDVAETDKRETTIGDIHGEEFDITYPKEDFYLQGFTFKKKNEEYFILLIGRKPIDDTAISVFYDLIISIS